MTKKTRGSEWFALRRCLVILRRLRQGPASGAELIKTVDYGLDEEAYTREPRARQKAFERDIAHLRDSLEVQIAYDRPQRVYILLDPGPYGAIELSARALDALRLLSDTFMGQVGETAEIQRLIDEVVALLSPDAKRRLERGRPGLDMDVFQDVDPVAISSHVWDIVNQAVQSARKLTFNYRSPAHDDQLPRYHEVAPYAIQFKRGHWYLYAYSLKWLNPHGKQNWDEHHLNFRIHYILDDDKLQIFPQVVAQTPRTPPRYLIHYRLAPPVGRGHISRHFEDMEVEQDPKTGWAEVRGYTPDLFEAVRILLAYGENCIVLGGEEVLRRVRDKVERMAQNYGFWEAD